MTFEEIKKQKIAEWRKKQAELKKLKAEEMALREEILTNVFLYEGDDREGVYDSRLSESELLKASFGVTLSLQNENDETAEMLTKLIAIDEEIANELVSWQPKLNKKVYDNLQPEIREIVDKCVVSKPKKPSLKVVEK